MTRLFAWGVAAIALLGAGSVALIAVATAHIPWTPPERRGEVPELPAPQLADPPPVARSLDPMPDPIDPSAAEDGVPEATPEVSLGVYPVPEPAELFEQAPPSAPAHHQPWSSVALKPRDLRTLWIEIANQRPELPRCWAREPRAVPRPAGPGAPPAPAALMLELESAGDTLRVVDAPVDAPGGDSAATVACAQAQLRGLTFDLPTTVAGSPIASPGARTRIRYVLQ
jgi:hypothetical protein